MAVPPVEARSLSSLTQLFANPPQYPRNPTHRALDALVLYIVRVPGSKDVFLTPLKPPTKTSVSVEAIESSLYYLHVCTPEDEAVRKSLEDIRQQTGRDDGHIRPIHRKPLSSLQPAEQVPRNKIGILDTIPSSAVSAKREEENGWHTANPVGNTSFPSREPSLGNSTISRKPIGPRPLTSRSKNSETFLVSAGLAQTPGTQEKSATNRKENISPHIKSSEDRELGRYENNLECSWRQSFSTAPSPKPESMATESESRPPLSERRPSSTPSCIAEQSFKVTIVRRDPTSGAQWNVGTLFRKSEVSPAEDACLRIDISTPGYQRFAGRPNLNASKLQATERGAVANVDDSAQRRASASGGITSSPQHSTAPSFTSEVMLGRPPTSRPRKRSQHHNRSSSDSLPMSLPEPSIPISPTQQPRLSFGSPWRGACIFTTGLDGRSLKCRHHLPVNNLEQQRDTSAPVAELRFNLPWSALKSRDVNTSSVSGTGQENSKRPTSFTQFSGDAKHNFQKGMSRIKQEIRSSNSTATATTSSPSSQPRPRSTSNVHSGPASDSDHTSSSSSSAPRLDLKLGQERAGGGRKGKSAKLGKLVLQDEGLKMADLVVAACMGVWWGVWDGSGGGGGM